MLDRPLPEAQRGLLADEFVELRANVLQHASMEQIDLIEAVTHPCVREYVVQARRMFRPGTRGKKKVHVVMIKVDHVQKETVYNPGFEPVFFEK